MDLDVQTLRQEAHVDRSPAVGAAFDSSAEIAAARLMAREFLTSLQAEHGLPVPPQTMGVVQLVVSELVTNASKYAPGPCLVDLELKGGAVEISVWDSSTTLPSVQAADPERIGQHGLEIVMAVCQSFSVHRAPVGKRIAASVALG
ncbi:ATP-binding protein [Streptomyces sp. Q6]|uniref:ATP-binding protein n=1 Tax=Streptomyces citrinus TaxID=3118173 RepID=A0ACD5ANG0_9ACTN